MNGESLMPWGEHKGKPLQSVPPDYLSWLLSQRWIVDWPDMHTYLKALHLEKSEARLARNDDIPAEFGTFQDYLDDVRGS